MTDASTDSRMLCLLALVPAATKRLKISRPFLRNSPLGTCSGCKGYCLRDSRRPGFPCQVGLLPLGETAKKRRNKEEKDKWRRKRGVFFSRNSSTFNTDNLSNIWSDINPNLFLIEKIIHFYSLPPFIPYAHQILFTLLIIFTSKIFLSINQFWRIATKRHKTNCQECAVSCPKRCEMWWNSPAWHWSPSWHWSRWTWRSALWLSALLLRSWFACRKNLARLNISGWITQSRRVAFDGFVFTFLNPPNCS